MRQLVILTAVLILGISNVAEAQYGGDPYRSYTDQMILDRMNLRRAAERRAAIHKHKSSAKTGKHLAQKRTAIAPKVPKITGVSYDVARKRLIAAGWKPSLHPRSYANSPNIQGGNGQVFWKKGYREIAESSGTGKAFCRFLFQDANGRILTVTTAGEEDPNGAYKAVVNNYSLAA
jgi:hypothetical protein